MIFVALRIGQRFRKETIRKIRSNTLSYKNQYGIAKPGPARIGPITRKDKIRPNTLKYKCSIRTDLVSLSYFTVLRSAEFWSVWGRHPYGPIRSLTVDARIMVYCSYLGVLRAFQFLGGNSHNFGGKFAVAPRYTPCV